VYFLFDGTYESKYPEFKKKSKALGIGQGWHEATVERFDSTCQENKMKNSKTMEHYIIACQGRAFTIIGTAISAYQQVTALEE